MSFVHLTVASEYSVNYSICRIKEIVAAAAADSMPAVAITDHNNLYGAFKFYKAAIASKIKPIIGARVDLITSNITFSGYFYCQNYAGYKILNQLIFAARNQPIDLDELAKFNIEHLILLLSPNKNLTLKQPDLTKLFAEFPEKAYLGLTRLDPEIENYVWQLANSHKLPVAATLPVCFIKPEDHVAHEVRVCINRSELYKADAHRYSKQQWFKPTSVMAELFHDQPLALKNAVAISERCNFSFEQGVNHLPLFPVDESKSLEQYFAEVSEQGLQDRFAVNIADTADKQVYQQRLTTENKIIQEMKFSGYFLIVADFIKWSREHAIPVGPGRGSGAGSLVAYALGITDIDPIEYGLLFERFLNPERVSMPDFDIDFCMDGRDRVIDYVAHKYGEDHVSQIITFGTLAAKAVVRDVGRVLGHPYGFMDAIAKLIPMDLGMTLAKALANTSELQERCDREPEVEKIFNLAQKLEGLVRQVGRHAGGVVIAPRPLLDFMPVDFEPDQGSVSQFDKDDLESIGLVKFDFLGLRTLTIIDWTLQSIKNSGLPEVLLHKVALDDEKVFTMLQAGQSTAVFQLESRGMKELIKRLKPDCFEDIVSLVALFRPGPLQSGMVDDFIDRKHGKAEIVHLHPSIESVLEPTYGVILYQEQVMQIAQVLSGYTLGGADLLRRAMGKKKPEEMAKQRGIFIDGAIANNVSAELAGNIFDVIEKFAGYGFNRSHSVAYAMLSYQTAWFKAHYPSHFMVSVLTSDMDNTEKVITMLDDCKQIGLKVRPPNIEEGDFGFTVNKNNEIIYGLGAIKGVGEAAAKAIVEFRMSAGKIGDLSELVSCLAKVGKLNKKLIESLCYSGALDVWGVERSLIIASIEHATKHVTQAQKQAMLGQGDLFGTQTVQFNYISAPALSLSKKLEFEKSVLGYYASGHPLDSMRSELKELGFKANSSIGLGRNKRLVGMVSGTRFMQSKTGRAMLFFLLSDGSSQIDVAVFGKHVPDAKETLKETEFVVVEGDASIDERNNGMRLQATAVMALDDFKFSKAKVIYIDIDKAAAPADFIEVLQARFHNFPRGEVRIILTYDGESVLAGSDYHIELQSYFVGTLAEIPWINHSFGYQIPESCRSYD